MKEPHIHALVNIKDTPILVFEQGRGRLDILGYHLGFGAQKKVTKAAAMAAMESAAPPLCIHKGPGHFSAVVRVRPRAGGPIRCKRNMHVFGAHKNGAIVLE